MKKYLKIGCTCIFSLLILWGCQQAGTDASEVSKSPVALVEVTSVADSSLAEFIELTAVSAYLQKSYIKANINGYVQSADAQVGKSVRSKQLLFNLITKEARSIGNAVNQLDPDFKFSGISHVRADQAGFITQVSHQQGDYVQDGELLATISNKNSLVFLLDLPYEYHQIMKENKLLSVLLPDGQQMKGSISGVMPNVDTLSQTQRYVIRVQADHEIPEGLMAKVKLTKSYKQNTQVLPKSAVLASETEDEFWVMKLLNDSVAVRVNIEKGMENNQRVEVLEPRFLPSDRIITKGNYGLADTARISIQK